MKTDIEIAQAADIQPITKIAEKIGLSFDDIELYGKYKAKIPLEVLESLMNKPMGNWF
ncbi:Formate--tetrahydrofolate ligase [Lactococcus lactis]|nr:Formate--tetrahydrofolate ligase [Lactococcus lactis]